MENRVSFAMANISSIFLFSNSAKEKLLVLCEHNNSDNYSLDLMIDERLGNQNDIIVKGKELLKCIELAN